LADADERVRATSSPESFDELVGVGARHCKLQRELVFHHCFDSDSDAFLLLTQLSTTRLSCLAWLPEFLGVLQMLVMQNSPQRHSASLYGQYILPQA
jgi:hypothetical protein